MSFPVVGVVGGGQLARMLHPAAVALGVRLKLLAEAAGSAAAQVIPDTVVGDYADLDTLRRFAAGCDVLTFDHEHVPTEHLRALVADGVTVRPGPDALVHAQDKQCMRERLTAAGLPCPAWTPVASYDDLAALAGQTGWPVVLKAARSGYDGKGVWVVDGAQAACTVIDTAADRGLRLIAEQRVGFVRELAAQVARSPSGQAAAYPVVETVQVGGINREVIAPAPVDDDVALAAQQVALRVAAELDVVGMLAVELFETSGAVLVNELAMRPHNSGHWSIDGAVTSQFEQHLRAVLDLPLGDPSPHAPYAVMVNVLGGDQPDLYGGYPHVLARDPGVKVHVYGKDVKPGRKVGHVTVLGADVTDLLARGRHAAAFLRGEIDA